MPQGYVPPSPRRQAALAGGRRSRSIRTAYNRTAVRVPRRNTYNKPVARALRKPRRPATKVARNKSAVLTLGRQVAMLQNQKFGILQTQTQSCLWQGTVAPTALPLPAQPIAIGVNNFYEQTTFRGLVTGTTATFEDSASFAKQTYQADLDDQYEWLSRMNTDIVSANAYLPVYTRLNFRFHFRKTGPSEPGVIRIDLVKIRDVNSTNKISTNVPSALGAFRNLAITPSDPARNYYNAEFHQVISSKFLKVRNPNRTATDSIDSYVMHTMSRKFGHSDFLDPNFNDNPTGQAFWTNVPRNKQLWLIISLDAQASSMLQKIECARLCRWRDHHAQA